MQINSASSYTPSNSSLATGEQNRVAEQRDPLRIQKIQESSQASSQQVKEQAQQPPKVERFDIDPQAIALIEQEQQSQQSQTSQTLGTSNQSSDQSRQKTNSTAYDQPPSQNKSAVAAYQSVDSISQRENIQQIFGVDLFA